MTIRATGWYHDAACWSRYCDRADATVELERKQIGNSVTTSLVVSTSVPTVVDPLMSLMGP